MSEDISNVNTQTSAQTDANQTAQTALDNAADNFKGSTNTEQRARDLGWRPKEEFNGDDEHVWVDAGEFLRRGELIDKIKSLSKKNKDTERTMAMLVEHHKKVRETEFKNAIKYLQNQRKEALVQGDVDKVLQLEEKEAAVKEQLQEFKQEITEAARNNEGPPPEFFQFVERNPWYQKDQEATMDADALGVRYRASYPDADYNDVLNHVEKKMKALHPHLFKSKPSASAVDSSSTAAGRNTSNNKNDTSFMSHEEKAAMATFVRKGIMTEAQYIEELKRVRNQ